MTPWELVLWAIAAALAIVIVGLAVALAVLAVRSGLTASTGPKPKADRS